MALDLFNRKRKITAINELESVRKNYETLAKKANEKIRALYEKRKEASEVMANMELILNECATNARLLRSVVSARESIRQFDEAVKQVEAANTNSWKSSCFSENSISSDRVTASLGSIESAVLANTTFGSIRMNNEVSARDLANFSDVGSITVGTVGALGLSVAAPLVISAGATILSLFNPLPLAALGISAWNLKKTNDIRRQSQEIRRRSNDIELFVSDIERTIEKIEKYSKDLDKEIENPEDVNSFAVSTAVNKLSNLINKRFYI
ncbi:MAG: hypothetical protein HDS42_00205 [Bacteroides sp.]|nr:hypothetical protein [Bacteroides sp.]